MREIKLRSWCEQTKKMEYGIEDCISGCLNDYDNLMLYIGRKDKYGKEIYESDIVKFTQFVHGIRKPRLKEIAYTNIEVINFMRIDGFYPFNEPEFLYDECEIIGNRFENPKLLEEKNDGD